MFDRLGDPRPPMPGPEIRDGVYRRAEQIRRRRRLGAAASVVAFVLLLAALLVARWPGEDRHGPVVSTPITTAVTEVTTTVPPELRGIDFRGEQMSVDLPTVDGSQLGERVTNDPSAAVFQRVYSFTTPRGKVSVTRIEAAPARISSIVQGAGSVRRTSGKGRRYVIDPVDPSQLLWAVDDSIVVKVVVSGAVDPVVVLDALSYAPPTRAVCRRVRPDRRVGVSVDGGQLWGRRNGGNCAPFALSPTVVPNSCQERQPVGPSPAPWVGGDAEELDIFEPGADAPVGAQQAFTNQDRRRAVTKRVACGGAEFEVELAQPEVDDGMVDRRAATPSRSHGSVTRSGSSTASRCACRLWSSASVIRTRPTGRCWRFPATTNWARQRWVSRSCSSAVVGANPHSGGPSMHWGCVRSAPSQSQSTLRIAWRCTHTPPRWVDRGGRALSSNAATVWP